jgi:hypothetical protein
MLKNFLLILFFFFAFQSLSQDTIAKLPSFDTVPTWRLNGNLRINFSQVYLNNWIAGGQSAYAAAGFFDGALNYKKIKHQWESRIELGYGFLNNRNDGFMKTDDKISMLSNYSYKAFNSFNYSFLASFRTQFYPGFNYPNREIIISTFLAPAYLVTSIGMNYKRDKLLTINLSPLATRLTIVNEPSLSQAGAFGVEPGRRIREEIGSYFKGTYRKENLWEGITLQVNLDLFSNYLEKPENIDINMETMVVFKINKYLACNISTHLIYDDDIRIGFDTTGDGELDTFGPRTQFKEVLSIGLSFRF